MSRRLRLHRRFWKTFIEHHHLPDDIKCKADQNDSDYICPGRSNSQRAPHKIVSRHAAQDIAVEVVVNDVKKRTQAEENEHQPNQKGIPDPSRLQSYQPDRQKENVPYVWAVAWYCIPPARGAKV